MISDQNTVRPLLNFGIEIPSPLMFGSDVEAGDLPLRITLGHEVSFVVIRGGTPEVRHGDFLDEFSAGIDIGSETGMDRRKLCGKVLSADADVGFSADQSQRFFAGEGNRLPRENILSEGNLVSGRRPGAVFLQ